MTDRDRTHLHVVTDDTWDDAAAVSDMPAADKGGWEFVGVLGPYATRMTTDETLAELARRESPDVPREQRILFVTDASGRTWEVGLGWLADHYTHELCAMRGLVKTGMQGLEYADFVRRSTQAVLADPTAALRFLGYRLPG